MLIGVTAASAVIAMSTVGFATEETSDDFAAVYNTDKTVSVSADEWAKVAANDNNNQYTLVIVPAGWTGISEGDTDASDDIFYINQDSSSNMQEDVASVAFLNDLADGTYEVRVGSDNNSFDGYKVATFVVGGEEDVRDFITSADTDKGTITSNANSTTAGTAWAFDGYSEEVSVALDATKYPNAGDATSGYTLKVVDANGTEIALASVYYSSERNKYVALIPTDVTGYKFEIVSGGNTNTVIAKYGDVLINTQNAINAADVSVLTRYVKGLASVTDLQKVTGDLVLDGKVNAGDVSALTRYVKQLSTSLPVTSK